MEDDQFPFGEDFQWHGKVFLGEGSYGKVYKVKSLKDGQFYAIKAIKMDEFNRDPSLMSSLKGEIAVTNEIKSPYTVQMLAFKIGHKTTYMILELCDSDLRDELAKKKIEEPKCVEIFDQIMKGFQQIVGKGYIHRDIKPANVLVKNNIHKVADFGFACKADILCRKKLNDICGTPIYMAPQLLKNQPYTAKSDIWSLGLMLYEMIFGYPPWPARSLDEYLNGIFTCPLRFPYNGPIGQNTKDFIRRSLVIDQGKRMTWKQVFEHPLIKHKNVGTDVPSVEVGAYVKKILLTIQNNIQRKQININNIIGKFKTQKVNIVVFTALIRQIQPAITSYQIQILFKYLDTQKVGFVSWSVIEEKVLLVDFRSYDDILSRKIDEIVAILIERKENLLTVFNRIDSNHTNNLDYTQFTQFIKAIAPNYTSQEILQLFGLFDVDKNKLISRDQFIGLLTKRMPAQKKQHEPTLVSVRGKRNLQNLIGYLKWSNKSAEKVMQQGEIDHQSGISKMEFQILLNKKFGFTITKQEIEEVFHIIDTSNNGKITYDELINILK